MFKLKTVLALLQETASDWMSDNAPRLGAALAYYTVFSISPLMVIVVAIVGLWLGREAARTEIYTEITGLVGPESARAIESMMAHVHQTGTGTLATVIAIVTLLIGSTGVFTELQDALNTIWGVKPKPNRPGWLMLIRARVLSFAMILAIGFLLLVSLVLSAALAGLGRYVASFAPELHRLWAVANLVVSLGVITLLFALIFKVLPDVHIAWRDVWIGALITAFLFSTGKFLLSLYLGKTGLESAYGAAGSVVVILVWVYYSAQILFFGAEFTQVYASRFGRSLAPVPYAQTIPVEDKIPAALNRRGEVHSELESISGRLRKRSRLRKDLGPKRSPWKLGFPWWRSSRGCGSGNADGGRRYTTLSLAAKGRLGNTSA
jgi:membrane protein